MDLELTGRFDLCDIRDFKVTVAGTNGVLPFAQMRCFLTFDPVPCPAMAIRRVHAYDSIHLCHDALTMML